MFNNKRYNLISIFFYLFFLFSNQYLYSIEYITNKTQYPILGIGLNAGFSTGYLFSCRIEFENFNIQLTLWPPLLYSYQTCYGITVYNNLIGNEISRSYLYYSAVLNYSPIISINTNYYLSIDGNLNFSIGFGFEYFVFKKFGINLMFGYAIYNRFINGHHFGITFETGLFYYFNRIIK